MGSSEGKEAREFSIFYQSSMSQHRKKIPLSPSQNFKPFKLFLSNILSNIDEMSDLESNRQQKRIKFKDGSTYEGAFSLKTSLTGKGHLKLSTGQQFIGTFQNNKPVEGLYHTSKFQYNGQFSNFLPHGQGKMKFHQGINTYTGIFRDGKRHGKGTYLIRNSKIKANWVQDIMEGLGVVKIGKHYLFRGNFNKFKREGYGEETFKRSCVYKGNYENNARCGYGTFHIYGESLYEGEWKNDKMHGKGAMKLYEDGRISNLVEGIYSENQLVKKCKVQLIKPKRQYIYTGFTSSGESEDEEDENPNKKMFDRIQFYNSHIL